MPEETIITIEGQDIRNMKFEDIKNYFAQSGMEINIPAVAKPIIKQNFGKPKPVYHQTSSQERQEISPFDVVDETTLNIMDTVQIERKLRELTTNIEHINSKLQVFKDEIHKSILQQTTDISFQITKEHTEILDAKINSLVSRTVKVYKKMNGKKYAIIELKEEKSVEKIN